MSARQRSYLIEDNWSRSVDVEQEHVIGPNSGKQVCMIFVFGGQRYCAVVGRVVLSKKSFQDRYHGSLRRGEAMAFAERKSVEGIVAREKKQP